MFTADPSTLFSRMHFYTCWEPLSRHYAATSGKVMKCFPIVQATESLLLIFWPAGLLTLWHSKVQPIQCTPVPISLENVQESSLLTVPQGRVSDLWWAGFNQVYLQCILWGSLSHCFRLRHCPKWRTPSLLWALYVHWSAQTVFIRCQGQTENSFNKGIMEVYRIRKGSFRLSELNWRRKERKMLQLLYFKKMNAAGYKVKEVKYLEQMSCPC